MKLKFKLFTLLFSIVFSFTLVSTTFAKSIDFKDLNLVPWAEDEINFLVERGIINGYSDTIFGPKDLITRAQATVLLVNALYPDEVAQNPNPFPDVEDGLYYTKAITIAAEKDIISGYADGSFQPNKKITRGETSSLINRAFSVSKGERVVGFADTLGWSKEHILNLASNGIIAGYDDGTFRPNKEISRAEFAVIVARTIHPGFIPPVEDNNSQDDEFTKFEKEVLRLTNIERVSHGLEPLISDQKLSEIARLKSQDMLDFNYFDHYSPNYGSPFDMMKSFGINYRSAAENIGAGYIDPESVVIGWMNSPGHRANILNPSHTHLGIGYAKGGEYRHYWTQMFMRPL